jgi:ATP-dependent Lon protease
VLQLLKLPDGTVKVLVEGEQRGAVERFSEVDGHCRAEVSLIDEVDAAERESEVFVRSLLSQFEQYVQLGKKVPAEVLSSLNSIDEPGRLVDTMAAHMALKIEQKQEILEIIDLRPVSSTCWRCWMPRSICCRSKTHPWPRQEANGAQPARVLPE